MYQYQYIHYYLLIVLQKRRRKLDPSMIGAPVNFQHLNHIGSGESGGDGVSNLFCLLFIFIYLYLFYLNHIGSGESGGDGVNNLI